MPLPVLAETVRSANHWWLVVSFCFAVSSYTFMGLTLWEGCATGASGDELLQAAIAAHGSHPEASELVSAILDEMVDAGVLQAGSAS